MDVEGWVHVQAEVEYDCDPVVETAWVATLADEARRCTLPGPLVCVGYADMRGDDARETLSRHCRYPLMRGIDRKRGSTRRRLARAESRAGAELQGWV